MQVLIVIVSILWVVPAVLGLALYGACRLSRRVRERVVQGLFGSATAAPPPGPLPAAPKTVTKRSLVASAARPAEVRFQPHVAKAARTTGSTRPDNFLQT